jgi:hypothetical protein
LYFTVRVRPEWVVATNWPTLEKLMLVKVFGEL